eukprot:838285-Rhodomonas_salina.1
MLGAYAQAGDDGAGSDGVAGRARQGGCSRRRTACASLSNRTRPNPTNRCEQKPTEPERTGQSRTEQNADRRDRTEPNRTQTT